MGGSRRWLVATILFAMGSTAAAAEIESAGDECSERQDVVDARDDVEESTLPPHGAYQALDILNLSAWRTDEGLTFQVSLAADPREEREALNFYWVHLEVAADQDQSRPTTWTIQRAPAYDRIRTMYWEDRAEYAVTWNQTSFNFAVPWSAFERQYGKAWPVAFGSPRATSEGPYHPDNPLLDEIRWASQQTQHDWAIGHTELVPIVDCPDAAPTPEVAPDSRSSDTPIGGAWPLLVAMAAAVALTRRIR